MRSPILSRLVPVTAGRSRGKKAIVLPYAAIQHMAPGELVWESLVGPARGKIDIYGLLLPWGILSEEALTHNTELLVHTRSPRESRAARDAAMRVRAWLNSDADQYSTVALVAYGRLMPVWSRAVEKSKASERVRLISVNSRGRGLIGSAVRRQVRDVVLA
jgi:hypothetical protein